MTGPTLPTIKRLFGLSGNRCPLPSCPNTLVDPSGKVTGRICHVRGKSPRGPRYDPSQTDVERHGFDNLLLLCPIHHDVVDADEVAYPVARLLEIKRSHEASVRPTPEPSDETALQFLGTLQVSGPGSTVVISEGQSGGITVGTVNITPVPQFTPQPPELPSCFLPAADAFSALIERNFLFQFGGRDSDYVELLSGDLRRLFFSFFNEHLRSGTVNRLVVSGREGSGKTFNTLLLALQLSREEYEVHYCHDIRSSNLTADSLRSVLRTHDDSTILIIDNVLLDPIKAEQLVSAITRPGTYADTPLFLFLTRPLDEDTMLDTFGASTPILAMRDKFIDFERLIGLLFQKLGASDSAAAFLEDVSAGRFGSFFPKYRNMAFWNEVLRSLAPGSLRITGEQLLQRAHSFLRRKESYLLDLREPLSSLLPFFTQGSTVHREYAAQVIGEGAEELLRSLAHHGVVTTVEHDWQSDDRASKSALVVASRLHPTKAKMVAAVFREFYGYASDPSEALADYAERYLHNLYYVLGPYFDADEFRLLYRNPRIRALTRRYLLERHLGKKLDRLVRRFAVLDDATIDSLLDAEVIAAFARHVNGKHAWLVGKMYIFRALDRVSPKKTFELFCLLTPEAVTRTFLADDTEAGITSLAKWMEPFKNIYYDAPTPDAKKAVREYVKRVIDECRGEFVRRFEKRHQFFTQMHWMLKRLHGLRLGNYFLDGISPDKLIELIRTKDTNTVELCKYTLSDARHTSWTAPDGSRRTYYDIIRDALTYEDLKHVFDNPRSHLHDLTMNATHDFIAKALVRYAEDLNFKRKAAVESPYLREESLRLVRTNWFLSEQEKAKVVAAIAEAGEGG